MTCHPQTFTKKSRSLLIENGFFTYAKSCSKKSCSKKSCSKKTCFKDLSQNLNQFTLDHMRTDKVSDTDTNDFT